MSSALRQPVIAVAAAVALIGTVDPAAAPPTVALTSRQAIVVAQGISVTPAPGWTLGHRGPNWVALDNADTSAQLRVTVKPAGGTDPAAVLQADVGQFTANASANLRDVRSLTAPDVKPLQRNNFQQKAAIDYTADVLGPQSTIPVIGTFTELLNTANGTSAFIDFRQDGNASTQAAGDGGMMIASML